MQNVNVSFNVYIGRCVRVSEQEKCVGKEKQVQILFSQRSVRGYWNSLESPEDNLLEI